MPNQQGSSVAQSTTVPSNKAKVALFLGIITFISWVAPYVISGIHNQLLLIWTMAAVAVVGIALAVWGFKAHKWIASIAIILCLINIVPSFVVTQLLYQVGYIGNQSYSDTDFSIEVPHGWVTVTPQVDARSVRAAFALNNQDVYQPRLLITTANSDTNDLQTFGKSREAQIRQDASNTILVSKVAEVDGKQAYILKYSFSNQGNKITSVELLTLKNGLGYIVTISAEDATYTYNHSQINQALWSFTLK